MVYHIGWAKLFYQMYSGVFASPVPGQLIEICSVVCNCNTFSYKKTDLFET